MIKRVALVTGAAAGIGAASALRLSRDGIAVGVLDLDAARCADAVAAVRSAGGEAVALGADVSTAARLRQPWRNCVRRSALSRSWSTTPRSPAMCRSWK
jgi:2-hydroxycyclohexanecarboxyl-CoA dehydrogenase